MQPVGQATPPSAWFGQDCAADKDDENNKALIVKSLYKEFIELRLD
jgi:hypothetical protein